MADAPDPPWWRTRAQASRRERTPLTRALIVEAALTLLERDGLANVSMRKLAQELGTGAASLYWHVGDKEELLALLLDRIVRDAEVPDPDPENWQEQVKELMRAGRRNLQRHRDGAQLSLGRVPVGPNSLPVMERYLAVLAAAKLPKRVIGYASDMFSLYVGGFAYEESLRVPIVGSEQAGVQEMREYFGSLPAESFPNIRSLAGELTAGDLDERFEFAIDLLVRGLEAVAAACADDPGDAQ
jgi:AcrR family transcriptional regulator